LNPEEYAIMYEVEDHHWWYRGMAVLSRTLLNQVWPGDRGWRILDAGCGTGAAATGFLSDYGQVTGVDLSDQALHFCRLRRLADLGRASVDALPFASASFDLVVSFDVLCERSLQQDDQALAEFWRVLAPGGWVLLRLPALRWLRGQHDVAVHIVRRYTRQEVRRNLYAAGFVAPRVSYANAFLLPLALVRRWADRLAAGLHLAQPVKSDLTIRFGPFDKLFYTILAGEAPWVARGRLPLGVSVFALAQKPGGA